MERATHQTTRRANERLVLRTIYERGAISRADVARTTGLTRTTVSDVVDDLIVDGLAAESGVGPSTGGKAPILLSVPDGARHLIGVDVDGEQLRGVVVDLRGQVVRRRTRSLNGRDGEAALRDLESLVALLVRAPSVRSSGSASAPLASSTRAAGSCAGRSGSTGGTSHSRNGWTGGSDSRSA